ncbi:ribonuclease S-2-like [Fagus crenata]
MTVFHVFLLVLVIGFVHHSHGRTYESESITINGSTDTLPVKAPTNRPPLIPTTMECEYYFLYLAFQWPRSFCNTARDPCYSQIPDYFTVHGLWPQPYNRQCSSCCFDDDFQYTQLHGRVLHYMTNNWPSLVPGVRNYMFWNREYRKHGSCYYPFENHRGLYFRTTVDLAMQQIGNVTHMLFDEGLIELGTNYFLCDFESRIYDLLNYIPTLHYNRLGQLSEIRFCVHRPNGHDSFHVLESLPVSIMILEDTCLNTYHISVV